MEKISVELVRREYRLFLLAGSFLSRFFPALLADGAEVAASCRYYPFIGLLLGAVGSLLAWLVHWRLNVLLPDAGVLPSLGGAFVFVAWLAFVTRGLHWDGWADLCDALGASPDLRSERFLQALKDSRIGVFGVLAIVFGVCGHLFLVWLFFERGFLFLLPLVPLWGRQLALWLAFGSAKGWSAPPQVGGLGSLCVNGAHAPCVLWTTVFSGLLLFLALPWVCILLVCAFSCLLLYGLSIISRRSSIFNGDFLGVAIIGGEFCLLLAVAFV